MAYERCQYVEEVMSKIVGSSKNHKGISTQEESDKMQFMAAQLLDDNLPGRHIGFLKRIINLNRRLTVSEANSVADIKYYG